MGGIDQNSVLEELRRIIGSTLFAGSGRAREFLDFVVRETLAGHADRLKGYRIGIEVFNRADDFDAEKSSVVRVEAQRLRHLLERYYLGEGRNNPVRIDLPKGRYIPVFDSLQNKAVPSAPEMKRDASIAVLPLRDLSNNPAQAYLADGLTEELIITLGNYPDISVMSGHATFRFRGDAIRTQEVGRNLNVSFLVWGSTCVSDDKIRINVELIDVVTGQQLWSQKYKRPFAVSNLLDIQEEVAKNVVANVADRYQGAIPRTLSRSMLQRPPTKPTIYEATMYLHHYNRNVSSESYCDARRAMEKAAQLDPDQAIVWAALGELLMDGYAHFDIEHDKSMVLERALQYTAKARGLDPGCEYCHWVEGEAYIMRREPENVVRVAETILAYEPSPSSVALAGWLLAVAGEWERGLGILQDQIEILQYFPSWFHHPFFLDHLRRDDYREALKSAQAFTDKGFIWGPMEKAAAFGMLGQSEEGEQHLAEVHALRPDFSDHPRRYLECFIMQDELVDQVIDGLYRSGLNKGDGALDRVVSGT